MVYSTRRFVVCLSMCHFVLVFFSPFSIAITSLGEERANRSAFRTFVRFVLVWICRFPLPLGVWEGLRFVIVALPGHFSYLFLYIICFISVHKHIMGRGGPNKYPQSIVLSRNIKKKYLFDYWISEFFIRKFSFLVVKYSIYFNRRVFVMYTRRDTVRQIKQM